MSSELETGLDGSFPEPGPLSLTITKSETTVVLRLTGEVDLATVGQVMAAVDRVDCDEITQLVFDLERVQFLDMAGLRAILRAKDHCRLHGVRVTVVKPRGYARRVFTLTRVHQELDLIDAWER
jgi:anti-anti-sigma factor